MELETWESDGGVQQRQFNLEPIHIHCVGADLAVGDATSICTYIDVISDSAYLSAAEGALDRAICTQVLEHLPEPLQVLREMSGALKPGNIYLLLEAGASTKSQDMLSVHLDWPTLSPAGNRYPGQANLTAGRLLLVSLTANPHNLASGSGQSDSPRKG